MDVPSFQLTFGVGSVGGMSTQSMFVQIVGDTTGEPDETFTLNMVPASPDSDNGLTQTFTILDNERKAIFQANNCDLPIKEHGASYFLD